MGAESVGDDEPASLDCHSNAEAVGDANGRVRSVVGEGLGEAGMQSAAITA
jgi:hypothetical protein